jgi:hypothetical protein
MQVTMTFKLTLRESHGTAKWIGLPSSKDVLGVVAVSTNVMIASTAKKRSEGPKTQR